MADSKEQQGAEIVISQREFLSKEEFQDAIRQCSEGFVTTLYSPLLQQPICLNLFRMISMCRMGSFYSDSFIGLPKSVHNV
jgi:hypothetical protein